MNNLTALKVGKMKNKKTQRQKGRLKNQINKLFPDIPMNIFVLVPFGIGVAIASALTDNLKISLLAGLVGGVLGWFWKEKFPTKTEKIILMNPDDIVPKVFDDYWFVEAVPADPVHRPEAYSLDRLRWSHKLKFTTEEGFSDVFIFRCSLEHGTYSLEPVPNETEHELEYWIREKTVDDEFEVEQTDYMEDTIDPNENNPNKDTNGIDNQNPSLTVNDNS